MVISEEGVGFEGDRFRTDLQFSLCSPIVGIFPGDSPSPEVWIEGGKVF